VGAVIRIVVYAASVWVAVALLEGLHFDGSPLALLGVALLMGVLNVIVKPILALFSLPLIVLTLGLFLLVVNALVLTLVIALSGVLGIAFTSDGFGWTILAALVISIVSWALESVLGAKG
jgi:putative membrane protein